MLRFNSLLLRILSLHIVAVAAITVLMPLSLYWLLKTEIGGIHRQSMHEQADRLSRFLTLDADGHWKLSLPADLEDVYSPAYGRYMFAIVDQRGKVLFSSLEDHARIFPDHRLTSEPTFQTVVKDSSTIAGASLPKTVDGEPIWFEVGEDLAHRDVLIDDVVASFLKRVAWITLPFLVLLIAIDILIIRRALRPVRRASGQALQIGPRRPDIRLATKNIPQEVQPLVLAVNEALDRLEHGFRMQRDFAADAAHELRTPLAILRTRIDTLSDREIAKTLLHDVEAMTRVVSQLLDMAELDAVFVGRDQKADLTAVAAEIVTFLAPLAVANSKNIALIASEKPVWINGDTELLSRAVRNLVENAIAHTPKDSCVEIVVEDSGVLRVRDEGRGIRDDEYEHLFKRFWRRDRSRPGGGLGLSIVQRIAEVHATTVTAKNRDSGGAEFSIAFPTEPVAQSSPSADPRQEAKSSHASHADQRA